MVLSVVLGKMGYSCEVRIGVTKDNRGKLQAHAWVESDGRIVLGNIPGMSRYTTLPPIERRLREDGSEAN